MSDQRTDATPDSLRTAGMNRRTAIKLAGAGVGVLAAAMARPSLAALLDSGPGLSTAVGAWDSASLLEDLQQLRPGWTPVCASLSTMECTAPLSDTVSYVGRGASQAQSCHVSILGYDGGAIHRRLVLNAMHPVAGHTDVRHGVFGVDQEQGSIRSGAAVSIVMPTVDQGLRFEIDVMAPAHPVQTTSVTLPAARGVYLLAVAAEDAKLPQWREWSMVAGTSSMLQRRLTRRTDGSSPTQFGYLLLTVDPIV